MKNSLRYLLTTSITMVLYSIYTAFFISEKSIRVSREMSVCVSMISMPITLLAFIMIVKIIIIMKCIDEKKSSTRIIKKIIAYKKIDNPFIWLLASSMIFFIYSTFLEIEYNLGFNMIMFFISLSMLIMSILVIKNIKP